MKEELVVDLLQEREDKQLQTKKGLLGKIASGFAQPKAIDGPGDPSGTLAAENSALKREVDELRRLLEKDLKLASAGGSKVQPAVLTADAVITRSRGTAGHFASTELNSELARLRDENCSLEQKVRFMTATHLAEVNGLKGEKTLVEQKWTKVVKGLREQVAALEEELSRLTVQREQNAMELASRVTGLAAEKLALEDELAQARQEAKASTAAAFKMTLERKKYLGNEEQMRKEIAALGVQVEALKHAKSGLEEELASVQHERDSLLQKLHEGNTTPEEPGTKVDVKGLEVQLEKVKREKAAVERDLRKELELASLQLASLLGDKASLEEKLQMERKLQTEMWKEP